MFGTADYAAMALLALIGIAAFLNLIRGTFGSWAKAKFLGIGAPGLAAATPFTPAAPKAPASAP